MSCYEGFCLGSCNGLLLTVAEEKNNDTIFVYLNPTFGNGWIIAFSTLVTLNVISIIVIVLYRKHRNTKDKHSYILLENK